MTGAPPEPGQRPRKQEQLPASEEIIEVAPGVLRLQVPIFFTGLGHVNCYALLDDRGAAVIDAGMPGKATWTALTARLRSAGLKVRDIHTVIITHSHPDHFGGAGRLAHEAGAELVTESRFHTWLLRPRHHHASHGTATASAGPAAAAGPAGSAGSEAPGAGQPDACDEIILGSAGDPSAEPAGDGQADHDDTGYYSPRKGTPWGGTGIPHLRKNIWMMRLGRLGLLPYARPPAPTRLVRDGDHLTLAGREWQAVYTPGHTGDHLCLYDPETELLVSGDHVLPTITPHVPGMSPLANPLATYMSSLTGLRDLGGVKLVLPAHGNPFQDLDGRIDAIIEHHMQRLDELRSLLAGGQASVIDLSRELFRQQVWGMMAESETYAHLEYLRLAGEVIRLDVDGQATYRLA